MMPLADKTRSMTPLFVFLLIVIPLFAGLYFLEPNQTTVLHDVRGSAVATDDRPGSGILGNRLTLMREQGVTINKHRLVFRGIHGRGIRIDLFLLELDPESAYPQYLTPEKARQGFTMAEVRLFLLWVSQRRLKLRIEPL